MSGKGEQRVDRAAPSIDELTRIVSDQARRLRALDLKVASIEQSVEQALSNSEARVERQLERGRLSVQDAVSLLRAAVGGHE